MINQHNHLTLTRIHTRTHQNQAAVPSPVKAAAAAPPKPAAPKVSQSVSEHQQALCLRACVVSQGRAP